MKRLVVLVTDQIYVKTHRYLQKVTECLDRHTSLYLAHVEGFSRGLSYASVRKFVSQQNVLFGTVEYLAERITQLAQSGSFELFVLALNQSSILPAMALRRLLHLPLRSGLIESCDKRRMRRLLGKCTNLAMDYREITPGELNSEVKPFDAEQYVVKPAFGMSSSDVKIFKEWGEAKHYAESMEHAKDWVPEGISQVLDLGATNARIIEPYIDGTEFSIDGWIQGDSFNAIVQHKLRVIHRTPRGDEFPVSEASSPSGLQDRWSFIGDGPTVSPPVHATSLPSSRGWTELKKSEKTICTFGRMVLDAIDFSEDVFHIEGRERRSDGRLFLIEVNPRAPGGSLWKSALFRSGYDLEFTDAMIQLGQSVLPPKSQTYKHVLHYPFYAMHPGILSDWGDLFGRKAKAVLGLQINKAVKLGHHFQAEDMSEEPYLAFAVAYDDTLDGLLRKCRAVLKLNPPYIRPFL